MRANIPATLMSLVLLTGCAAGPEITPEMIATYDYGPQPTEQRFRELAEQAIRSRLRDPGSAQFEWPNAMARGVWRPVFSAPNFGYLTCARVNGRNAFGGYVGFTAFIVVVRNDAVTYVEMDDPRSSYLREQCSAAGRPV